MTPKMETPPAGGTANGAKFKADEASMPNYRSRPVFATLPRIRAAHVARLFGVSDQAAATIASLGFAGAAS